MNERENGEFIRGYESALEMLEMAADSAARTISKRELSKEDLATTINRFITLTYVMRFELEQMDDEICNGDCENCENLEEGFIGFIEDLVNVLDKKEEK